MKGFLLVFLGAGLGGAARHGVNLAAARMFGLGFPWGTLIVNIAGSFAIGAFAAWLAFRAGEAGAPAWTQGARLLLVTGLLGGFTTFSAFSLDVALLWERGAVMAAGAYVAASVCLSIAAAFAGLAAIRAMS